MKKNCSFLLVSILLVCFAYCVDTEIRSLPEQSDWFCVLPGKPVSELERTSYGVALLTDQRCLVLVDCFEKKIYRQKNLDYKPRYLSVGVSDFIYVIDDNSRIHIYNPSCHELYEKKLEGRPS